MARSQFPFGGRLVHDVPFWVHPDHSEFHIRIRQDGSDSVPLTEPSRATSLLESADFYHRQGTWGVSLVLLMPDHLHALLYLPPDRALGKVIGKWKEYQRRTYGVLWQEGFFDHRLRNEESKSEKWAYIRRNPVALGLCKTPDDWPWWIERYPDGEIRRGY